MIIAIHLTLDKQRLKEYPNCLLLNDIMIIDTPGLDANEEDSKEALEAIYSSDALLLVHNLKKGELDSYEIDLLNLIKKTNPSISQKLTIVLTNLESCRDEKEAIEQKVMKKIKEIFVDNKRFFKIQI